MYKPLVRAGQLLTLGLFSSLLTAAESPRIAIIIDDLGYHLKRGQRAVDLPAAVTLSILPHGPNSQALARRASKRGKEIMLHAPMSNIAGIPLDDGALTSDMNRQQLVAVLRQGLAALPDAIGVNNHMGSLLTQQAAPMHWLMAELSKQQLFFVDSRTSADSLAFDIAQSYSLPSLKRDVFLDNQRDHAFIESQFQQLLRIAKKRGWALGIGHPYPETLAVLEEYLPQLKQQGVEVVTISALLTPQYFVTTEQKFDLYEDLPINDHINQQGHSNSIDSD
tara:strand:+ start:1871 stop:2707 length:837 start_codon:yes stop_codon:yes gene_type:complete